MGTVLLLRHLMGAFNQLKYCLEPGTATLRVINAPQIMINAEHDCNVRNSSLSTHSTECVLYRIYFNRLACITAVCSYYDKSRYSQPFPSNHGTLESSVLPIVT